MSLENWEIGTARLSGHGEIVYDDSEKPSEYTEHYTVLMADESVIASSNNVEGIPEVGDKSTVESLKHLRVCSIRFNKINERSRAWDVAVTYGVPGSGRRTLIAEDDGSDYISVSWSTDEITTDFCYDLAYNPVVNAAGDPFDTLPQKVEFVPHITIVRREKKFPDMTFNGTVNKEEVTILGIKFAPHCARLKMQINQVAAKKPYEVTYEIIGMKNIAPKDDAESPSDVRDYGWDIPMLQCGYQFLDDDMNLCKFTTYDSSGIEREVSMPQLIDKFGKDHRGQDPAYTCFIPYQEDDWNDLKFPSDPKDVQIDGGTD